MTSKNSLLMSPSLTPLQMKIETREEFFAVKKHNKRLKCPLYQPQSIEDIHPLGFKLGLSFWESNPLDSFKPESSELDSTFAQDSQFRFKEKPLKRKINILNGLKRRESCNMVQEEPLVASLFGRSSAKQIGPLRPSLKKFIVPAQPRITDFQLLAKIGEGSYSSVYRAVHKATGFLCAVKILEKQTMREQQAAENVVRELKINSFLDHPNIAKLYSCFADAKYIYLICQYATDGNIYDTLYGPKLKLKKGLKTVEAAHFTKQICEAVEQLHGHSVMHRDLKPENILITMLDTIKLCDFGWSVYNPRNVLRNTLCGTPLYLAPQLISQQPYDASVDVWAVGVIAYEMLTEQIPFDISSPSELHKILSDEARLHKIRNKTAANFIELALQKDSSKRIAISELVHHPFVR